MKQLIVMFMLLLVQTVYSQNFIVISKHDLKLYVVNNTDTLFSSSIGVGKNYGDKTEEGDYKTPEGTFKIVQIQNAARWTHDFKDGYGMRKGAYGPYFFRLRTPGFTGIGIHGTCFPDQIGTRCTEGCIRLNNRDLEKLKEYVYIGMKCIIEKDM